MKFLIDEDVPIKLIRGASDPVNAGRSEEESRVFITLDKDFTNRSLYPPSRFNIIHIQIHPPYAEAVITAVAWLLKNIPANKIKGLIILRETGPVFFRE